MKIRKWNGMPISDEAIQRYRQEAFDFLRDKPGEEYWYTMSGDTLVFGLREEDCISIYHTKLQDYVGMIAVPSIEWKDIEDYSKSQLREDDLRYPATDNHHAPWNDDLPF